MTISPRMLTEAQACIRNIQRMLDGFGNDRLVAQRANDWTSNFLKAASTEPSRGTNPGIVTLGDGFTTHDQPQQSDPTGEAAIAPHEANYEQGLRRGIVALRVLEFVIAELTRPTTAAEEESTTAARMESDKMPGAGTCAACGKFRPGGRRELKVQHIDGYDLCYSHQTGRLKPRYNGWSVKRYVEHIKHSDRSKRAMRRPCLRCQGTGSVDWPPVECPDCNATGQRIDEAS